MSPYWDDWEDEPDDEPDFDTMFDENDEISLDEALELSLSQEEGEALP